jgi:hypothetical protein
MHPLENAYLSADLPEGKLVAICRFRDDLGPVVPQNPAVYFQVTIDPNKVSPSKRFIRFGDTQGDEVVGWQVREYIVVLEVLGVLRDGITVVPLEQQQAGREALEAAQKAA